MRGGALCCPYKAKHPVDVKSAAVPVSQICICLGAFCLTWAVWNWEKRKRG